MSEITLRNELVGGPFDGDAWLTDWVPHWVQEIARARPGVDGSFQWAEYRLNEAELALDEGVPCIRFRYQFVGVRESFPSWTTWVLVKSRRWTRQALRCVARLFRMAPLADQDHPVDANPEPAD
jgi:hypothetical protein